MVQLKKPLGEKPIFSVTIFASLTPSSHWRSKFLPLTIFPVLILALGLVSAEASLLGHRIQGRRRLSVTFPCFSSFLTAQTKLEHTLDINIYFDSVFANDLQTWPRLQYGPEKHLAAHSFLCFSLFNCSYFVSCPHLVQTVIPIANWGSVKDLQPRSKSAA